jgi:hypothetical protein
MEAFGKTYGVMLSWLLIRLPDILWTLIDGHYDQETGAYAWNLQNKMPICDEKLESTWNLWLQFQVNFRSTFWDITVIFGKKSDQKVKSHFSGHFGPFFMITASCHPIKVPETSKCILMHIDVYKHVFIKYFWPERCILAVFVVLIFACCLYANTLKMKLFCSWPSTTKCKDIGGMSMGDVHKNFGKIFWPFGVHLDDVTYSQIILWLWDVWRAA